MSKIVRAMFISAYSAILLHLLKSFLIDHHENHLEINYVLRTPGMLRKINREMRKNKRNITIMPQFERPQRLPTDLKYILQWTEAFYHYNAIFKNGQQSFLDYNCTYINCYLTHDKTFLTDPKYLDAILFDVENWDLYPVIRIPYQYYIFMASESASNYPICDPRFDSYYNWTWSYKLDSDIRWSYITILDKTGRTVGPEINMSWINPMKPTPKHVTDMLKSKNKAVAWFVSNCHSKNRREIIAKKLSKSLAKYNLKIDIYGWCGSNLTCPKDRIDECLELLSRDYYFYLAFENSNSEDYVTEKILYPLQHYTVPIVYGGADYSRFLPPGSYIDAEKLHSNRIASLIQKAMKDLEDYSNYFRWHNYYTYKESRQESGICSLCKMLHEPTKNISRVTEFRQWWNPKYREICKQEQDKIVLEII